MKMDNQLRIGFRQRKAGGFIVPPNERMTETIPIERYGCIEVAHPQ